MKKNNVYVGVLANSLLDMHNVRLSDELLKKLVEEQPIVPVTINFGKELIGVTKKLYEDKSGVCCEFELSDSDVPMLTQAFVVPGFSNIEEHLEGKVRVIDEGKLTSVAITLTPANLHLTPIEKGKK